MLMLLVLIVFGVGIVRTFFTPERTRQILTGRGETAGNVLAALLGIVTPFCSCSAVPLFMGIRAGWYSPGSNTVVSHRGSDDQRGRAGAALRYVRLESSGSIRDYWAWHSYSRGPGDWLAQNGTLR